MELDLITDIHKYCDNWCDRCIYSTRCELFIETIYKNERKKAVFNPEGFFNVLRDLFVQAYDSFEIYRPDSSGIEELSELYGAESNNWLEKNELFLKDNNKNTDITDALDVIRYYQYFISLKVKKSFESDIDEKLIQLKLAEVAASRSISAWYIIFKETGSEDIGKIIGILKSILILVDESNPELKSFYRPYFD
ncbi:hypothetical protein MROS_2269 [Melioribacter roseus P3M-2]|uniref:Uncharacterized protein n=1 Tax=Melioribacter roseus (strain DSM 23840 / JCM 17771 / VKM B-2668 / P3M-2) TaxID=1191523 RepID=I6ZU15_MELRP|nr:hypothetical protein [Melioribacter roseus]AFN75499.1 hypothetical protein MROS_2269 [Melioribacter roseus P3M-2]